MNARVTNTRTGTVLVHDFRLYKYFLKDLLVRYWYIILDFVDKYIIDPDNYTGVRDVTTFYYFCIACIA